MPLRAKRDGNVERAALAHRCIDSLSRGRGFDEFSGKQTNGREGNLTVCAFIVRIFRRRCLPTILRIISFASFIGRLRHVSLLCVQSRKMNRTASRASLSQPNAQSDRPKDTSRSAPLIRVDRDPGTTCDACCCRKVRPRRRRAGLSRNTLLRLPRWATLIWLGLAWPRLLALKWSQTR